MLCYETQQTKFHSSPSVETEISDMATKPRARVRVRVRSNLGYVIIYYCTNAMYYKQDFVHI